ncbi:MAG: hypothetical protein ACRDOL_22595 [Streptosporangiaceae bacterium]
MAELSPAARQSLAETLAYLAATQPHVITSGTRIADQLRLAYDMDDEAIAAVLDGAIQVGASYAQVLGCRHLLDYLRLLSAAAAELAHLDMP